MTRVECSYPLIPALSESHACETIFHALADAPTAHAMQIGEVVHVLVHGQIHVEGLSLKHDSHARQRPPGLACNVVAEDGDASGVGNEQPGEQRHQGRFACTVRAKKCGEPAGGDRQGNVIECLDIAIGIGDVLDADTRPGIHTRSDTLFSAANKPHSVLG